MASCARPLAGWPVATSPCRSPRTVRRNSNPRRLHAWRTPYQARVADSRLTRDQHYDRTRLGRDVQRPLGEPSRPRGQPTSDPSPAPMSPYSRTRPGCHDTQASLRLVGRATADSWRTAVARAARCPGVPLRRRGLSIDDRLSVDMQRQRPLPWTPTADRTSTCRYPEAGGMTLKPSVLERRIVGGREPADNAVVWQRPDSSITGVSQHGSASDRVLPSGGSPRASVERYECVRRAEVAQVRGSNERVTARGLSVIASLEDRQFDDAVNGGRRSVWTTVAGYRAR